MTFSANDVKRLSSRLAKMQLDEAQCEELTHDLVKIIGFIDRLQEVDITGVAPMHSPIEGFQRLRSDGVTSGTQQADVLANAPESGHGFFKVPKVIRSS